MSFDCFTHLLRQKLSHISGSAKQFCFLKHFHEWIITNEYWLCDCFAKAILRILAMPSSTASWMIINVPSMINDHHSCDCFAPVHWQNLCQNSGSSGSTVSWNISETAHKWLWVWWFLHISMKHFSEFWLF